MSRATATSLAALLALTAALAGCSEHWQGTGTVVDKQHVGPWCQTVPVYVAKGTTVPMTTCYPEEFYLEVQDSNGKHNVTVSSAEYAAATVGQIITINKENQ
ncbi:hypothetical protein [Arthrobacter woluwensis]|uniref:hypothetical protein n=1 Tax=Arthrobacter woluwensis TaxID=156980 RepID=UPI0011A59867|nr:hypothetical protein [Arthrobacter woluwensis]